MLNAGRNGTGARGNPAAGRIALFLRSALCVLTFPLLLAGCRTAVTGDWYLEKAIPARQIFSMDDASFKKDGTFTAAVTLDGRTLKESGRYEFNGFKLTLLPKDGGQQAFDANMKLNARMELTDKDRHCVLAKK